MSDQTFLLRAMEITSRFEGNDPWANITGNSDKQGLTCGALGLVFVSGEQQRLVNQFVAEHSAAALRNLMPQTGEEYIHLCNLPPLEGTQAIIAWSVTPRSSEVRQPYQRELSAFWKCDGMRQLQLDQAAEFGETANDIAGKWRQEFEFQDFAFCFDMVVHNGGTKGVGRDDVNHFLTSGQAQAGQAILDWCRSAGKAYADYASANKNAKLWSGLWEKAQEDQRELLVCAFLRSAKSIYKYQADTLNRLGVLALGAGYVHGDRYDLTSALQPSNETA